MTKRTAYPEILNGDDLEELIKSIKDMTVVTSFSGRRIDSYP
jgi:hypothetical protein